MTKGLPAVRFFVGSTGGLPAAGQLDLQAAVKVTQLVASRGPGCSDAMLSMSRAAVTAACRGGYAAAAVKCKCQARAGTVPKGFLQ